jgi:hypothetical protein
MGTTDPQDTAYLNDVDPEAPAAYDAHAIPVCVEGDVIVREFPARTVAATQAPLPAGANPTPVQVLPHSPNRSRAVIQAVGGTVYVGGHRGVTPGSGFQLLAGAQLVVLATAEVWACTDPVTATATAVHAYAEHRDG